MKLASLIDRDIPEKAFKLGPGLPNATMQPLAQWSSIAGMLCAPGCEAQTFMLLASFAAPLMSLFKTPEGGGIVSIHGGKRSGKSVALAAAASVWGEPRSITVPSWAPDRLERIAKLGNYPVIAEGMLNRDPAHTREFIIDFLTGHKQDTPWQTLLLSATGMPLFSTVMRTEDARPGLDLAVKVPPMLIEPKSTGRLEYTLTACRGWAGLAYLRYLCASNVTRWARGQLVSTLAGFNDDFGLGEEFRFTLRTIAAVHVAGMIVSRLGIVDVEADRVTKWALEKAVPQKKERAA